VSDDTDSPVIVWENCGYEGPDLKAVLLATRYNSEFVVTERVEFDVAKAKAPSS
jgi:hypothetical protein